MDETMILVSIKKCEDYKIEKVEKSIVLALKEIEFEIKEYQKVLIKPNILSQNTPEQAVTTHPIIIEAICKILKEKNCEIIIAESSGMFMQGGTKKGFKTSGIEKIGKKYDAKIVPFENTKIKTIKDNNAKILKEFPISTILDEVNCIINVPKLKTHSLMKYTGAVKNLYGLIPGGFKQNGHVIAQDEDSFGELLIDIYQNVKNKITLNILDGIIGLEGNGPGSSGNPRKTSLILVSKDALAMDMVATEIIGYNPLEIKTNTIGIKRELINQMDVNVIGEKISDVKINYKKPITVKPNIIIKIISFMIPKKLLFSQITARPKINNNKCIKCQACYKICPTKAIRMPDYPVIDSKKCITCYCCHEVCPKKAIDLKRTWIIEMAANAYRKITNLKKYNRKSKDYYCNTGFENKKTLRWRNIR